MIKYKALITSGDILSALCKGENKFGMYCSVYTHDEHREFFTLEEMFKAIPWLNNPPKQQDAWNLLTSGSGFFLFNSKEEMEKAYAQTVGSDGPTGDNSYNGPVRTYALTCSSDGILWNENT